MGADRIWQDFKGHREFDHFTEKRGGVHCRSRQLLHGDGF
jgi:hypothetical protein